MLNSKNISSIFVLHILIVCINSTLNDRPLNIFQRLNEIDHGKEFNWLIQDILKQVHKDLTCLAIIWDISYKNIFSEDFFLRLKIKTVLKVLIKESEDLLSPNYDSVKVVKEIRRAGCNIYLLLLTNGDQASRFLRFGDRHRLIDTRAKFLMVYDHRLFHNQLHYLWKKIINIIFIRRYKESSRYELSTVPFPVPIKGMLIPRRVNTWRAGKFQTNTNLYREKTKELDGQILRAVVIQHVPSAIRMVDKPTPNDITVEGYKPIGFGGLEIEVLNSLKLAMNFKSLVYEPPNSEIEAWGQKQLNGSYSGLLGEISNGHADFALGSLYYTPYHLDLLDLSVPYATECLTFLTPEALTDNSWKTLILPFRLNMWIGIIVTFIFGAGFFYVFASIYNSLNKNQVINHPNRNTKTVSSIKIKQMFNIKDFKLLLKRKFPYSSLKFWNKNKSKNINSVQIYSKTNIHFKNNVKNLPTFESEGMFLFDSFNNSLLYTYGMLALVSLPKFPNGWALRIMTGCWWIYCILIVVSYRASLTAILATPQPRVTIDTVEELALSPVKCGGWGEQNKQFFTTSLDPASREIGKKFEIIKDPDAKDAISRIAKGTFSYYGNIYFLRSLIVKQGFLIQLPTKNNVSVRESENIKDQEKRTTNGHNLHIMSDCVINMPISIGLQKNSPLKPQVDKYIRLFIEAGLIKKWLNDVMTDTFIAEAPLSQEEIKALVDLRKLYAGFIALFTGYLISIIVLMAENIHWFFIVKKDPLFDKYYLSKYYKKN